jgi:CO/xanthine dehydrogenase FAD-binding subunit
MPAEPPIDTPRHLFEAYERLAAGPTRPIAGGTDVHGRDHRRARAIPDRMLDLSRIDELRGIALEASGLVLGARTTYTEIRRSALCREHLPALVEASATIGAAQIQNRGTLGGNIANASPAGDTLPILLAADAQILVGGQRGEREIAAKDFFISYRKTALAPDELILQVRFPLGQGRELRFRKVGTRRAQAISKVVLALAWRDVGAQGWLDVRVALGSVAATPIRAAATERVLEGARPTPEVADLAAETLRRGAQAN